MSMLALTREFYCRPADIELGKIDRPEPGPDDVLLKVEAASLNPLDWHMITGIPYMMRMDNGLRGPKSPSLGTDVSGVVEAVGANVTRFAPGDAVFGMGSGSFAEHCTSSENQLAHKPAEISFDAAAAIPVAGITALQSLRDAGRVSAGERVLVIGASGGVGGYGVQMAKAMRATVTGVCSTGNVDLVRDLGADEVIDYTAGDFAGTGPYDLIIDNVGNRSSRVYKSALTERGRLVIVSGPKANRWFGPAIHVVKTSLSFAFSKKSAAMVLAKENADDMAVLADYLETGTVAPTISATIGLGDVGAALTELGRGHTRGKIVVRP